MKIIGGKFGGRKLYTPSNKDVRPTSDKIRGAVFNMLQSRGAVERVRVLDAFCGTGALGLEALSRGAEHVTFIDKARSSLDLARQNAEMLGAMDICDFTLKDALKMPIRTDNEKAYSLVFLDPPYNKGLVNLALQSLKAGDWLSPDCWIVCESERTYTYTNIDTFLIDSEKTYGDIKITLLRSEPINL